MFRRKKCVDTGKYGSVGEDEEKDVKMNKFGWKGRKLARRTNINRDIDVIRLAQTV